jgi:Family of unknown function (DUF6445)
MATTIIQDGFFKNFDTVRQLADTAHYQDEIYPTDNTSYPGICKDLPAALVRALVRKLEGLGFSRVVPALTFLRMSVPSGNRAPHYIHTDRLTGQWTLLVYLQDGLDPEAGTGFYSHIATGMDEHPSDDAGIEIWKRDQKHMERWQQLRLVSMVRNRAVIFSSEQFHCALPIGGFGDGPKDGRVVLTMFFNAERQ